VVQSPQPQELKQFDAYLRRELPRKIRKELQVALQNMIGPIEETFKNDLENIVRNCQEALTRTYLEITRSSGSSSGTQTEPGDPVNTAQPTGITDSSGFSPYCPVIDESDRLPQYFLPPDSTLESWPEVMTSIDNQYPPTLSDSAYFSLSDNLDGAFLDNETWLMRPPMTNTSDPTWEQ
jgi:hypothetical protein